MSVRKTDYFIADVELQYQWYAEHAGWDIADQYLAAVEGTCALIERQPLLGPVVRFVHPRLTGWRFFIVFHPFHRHVLFYEAVDQEVILRRALHGHRSFPQRLLDPPGAD